MPSCTKEQREAALRELEECGGSVIQVIRRRGYPSRQTMYQWINQADASHQRTAGRPWSHYDPALKKEAVGLVSEGMDGGGVASALGVSSAAAACNWVRSSETAKEREASMPISPIDDGSRAYDGFDGDGSERIRQLELENDILREALIHLKGCGLERMTNREKTVIIDSPRLETGRALKEPAASLRISRSSYGYRRAAIARKDKYGDLRGDRGDLRRSRPNARVPLRHAWAEGPRGSIVVSEKAVRRIMSEENRVVIHDKKAKHCSSRKGGDIGCAAQSGEAGFPFGPAEPPSAHRYHRVRHPRRQGIPLAGSRLLRRGSGGMVDTDRTGRRTREQHAEGRMREAVAGRASGHPWR